MIRTWKIKDRALNADIDAVSFFNHMDCFLRPLRIDSLLQPMKPQKECVHLLVLAAGTPGTRLLQFCSPELAVARQEPEGHRAWILFRRLFMQVALDPQLPQYVLHASAVTNADASRTALICGFSNAGKTSIMLSLLKRGYRYLVDDYACLQISGHRLQAMPVGCTVTERTFAMIPELQSLRSDDCKFFCENRWQWTIQPGDLYPVAPPFETYRPTHLFFLFPNFGRDSSVAPCDRDSVLWWFQQGRLQSRGVTPIIGEHNLEHFHESFRLARYFADNVRCYIAHNGDLDSTVDLIEKAIEEDAPVGGPEVALRSQDYDGGNSIAKVQAVTATVWKMAP